MTTPIYTINYRRNLILYWRQFYPEWTIPLGFHVHHIKPKSTFIDKDDPAIHHPKNLIALHPDDHYTIHNCRGDKWCSGFTKVAHVNNKGSNNGMFGENTLEQRNEKPTFN